MSGVARPRVGATEEARFLPVNRRSSQARLLREQLHSTLDVRDMLDSSLLVENHVNR